ncbi:uncharacterized protein LOC116654390 [Coturnix japonica]|uniref:uncharacterized protein LOC116654390 n=1 Tax=Coturnix japonica TaxID=93934 RepID=UPI0013A5C52D|nr:uncharacterized protein LOC116654390 [Coturnix japonica]
MLVWGPAEFGLSLCPSSRGSVLGELVRVGLPEVCRVSLWRRCRGAAQSGVVQAALERLRVEAFRLGFGALGKLLPALAPGGGCGAVRGRRWGGSCRSGARWGWKVRSCGAAPSGFGASSAFFSSSSSSSSSSFLLRLLCRRSSGIPLRSEPGGGTRTKVRGALGARRVSSAHAPLPASWMPSPLHTDDAPCTPVTIQTGTTPVCSPAGGHSHFSKQSPAQHSK